MSDGQQQPARCWFEAGYLRRREVRGFLDYTGVTWVEHKGLLESTFVVSGTNEQVIRVWKAVQRAEAAQ